ncbi:MAG TPA: phosphatase PAP2 family protein [Treponemataceae bacterium]|nr:phosphatase PAP2 family protein [Treponemataceae bacterium]HPS45092.1 phosphatase PAP2 family protein [Treponemataceae bacterium]
MPNYAHKKNRRTVLMVAIALYAACQSGLWAADGDAPLDKDDVNAFDRLAIFQYSKAQDIVSDVTCYSAILVPAVFLRAAPSKDWLELGILYAGSSAVSFGSSELLKRAVSRDRPYMYFDDPPDDFLDSKDSEKSFPSRHSAMAFNGAGFTAAVFAIKYPDSPYRVPAVATAYGLAVATATLRVTGGSHFMTDVAAGALIGSATGFLVPWVNYRIFKHGVTVMASPSELSFRYRY